ncbi:hypothetical protein KUTeg_009744 [Tegillarca granosa]|uniref:TIR domain-containing protein n=1 Tax=Tegillarca granosa TaxID=220873 RepID=A0ABQ9F826_TEGGR|nr:hypothetical protein KUTeg_009744 [Tegillarca granosa]
MEATDDSALNLYIARSYAYIGHLLLSRGDLAIEKVTDKEPSIFLQSSFRKLIKDPWICFQEALEKGPEDTHVLNRFGKSLRNFANFKTKENNEKIKYLCEAYNYLSKSITKLPHSNWFAYVTRMRTSKDLAAVLDQINDNDFDSLIGRNDNDLAILGRERDSESWLLKARQDGVKCFNSKATEPDLGTLAKICQMLAKYPDVKKYGPQYVKKKEYIHEAIHYLNYALEMGGILGCISDRDFRIGRSIIDNIIDAVEHSCKIIFVITEDFIESRWCDYEVNPSTCCDVG